MRTNQINQPNMRTKITNYMIQPHKFTNRTDRMNQLNKKAKLTNQSPKQKNQSLSKLEPKVRLSNIPNLRNTFEIIRGLRPGAQSSVYIYIYIGCTWLNKHIGHAPLSLRFVFNLVHLVSVLSWGSLDVSKRRQATPKHPVPLMFLIDSWLFCGSGHQQPRMASEM